MSLFIEIFVASWISIRNGGQRINSVAASDRGLGIVFGGGLGVVFGGVAGWEVCGQGGSFGRMDELAQDNAEISCGGRLKSWTNGVGRRQSADGEVDL